MGLLQKIDTLGKRSATRKSLLRKSLDRLGGGDEEEELLAEDQVSETTTSPKYTKTEAKSELLKKINNLNLGIDTPAYLFLTLSEFIHFESGSLLMLDPSTDIFRPYAARGWNDSQETLERSPDEISAILSDYGPWPSYLEKKSLAGMRELFIESDSKKLETLFLAPFSVNQKLVALLLLSGVDPAGANLIETTLTKAHEIIAVRFDILQKIKRKTIESWNNLEKKIKPALKISINPIIDQILKENGYINPKYLQQDLLMVLGHIFRGMMRVYSENSTLILVADSNDIDRELVLHQSSRSLKRHFKATRTSLLLKPEVNKLAATESG